MALKAVIFDLDNTLYDFTSAHRRGLQALCDYGESRFDVPGDKFLAAYHEADRQLKRELPYVAACHNRVLIMQRMLEMLSLPSVVTPLELYETYWGAILRSIQPGEGAMELVTRLSRQRIRIGICTDMTAHIQHRKIAALGFTPYINVMVSSEESGVEKPNPKIFGDCLGKLRARPSETVYIGDSFERDIVGAHNAGIMPFWLNADGKPRPEGANFPFKELRSLKEML